MCRKSLAVFLYHFQCYTVRLCCRQLCLLRSAVFSVGSVVFPARSLVRDRWVGFAPGRVPGCSFSSCIGFYSCEDFH